MKKLKLVILILMASFLFTSAESFAYPRHRVHRVVYRVRPVHHTVVVKKYYVVRKPKIHHRHHKRVIRRVIYY